MIAYKDIEEEEKEEESKKNQRWFSRPTSENALAQSRMIVSLMACQRLPLKKRQGPPLPSTQLVLRSCISFI